MSDGNITATMTLTITDEVCRDFLSTCYEGGSAYWLACRNVKRDEDLNVLQILGCRDREDSTTKWGDADLNTIRLGFQRLLAPDADVAGYIKRDALAVLADKDSSAWDAETADCVLQFGLLGSLVYG